MESKTFSSSFTMVLSQPIVVPLTTMADLFSCFHPPIASRAQLKGIQCRSKKGEGWKTNRVPKADLCKKGKFLGTKARFLKNEEQGRQARRLASFWLRFKCKRRSRWKQTQGSLPQAENPSRKWWVTQARMRPHRRICLAETSSAKAGGTPAILAKVFQRP